MKIQDFKDIFSSKFFKKKCSVAYLFFFFFINSFIHGQSTVKEYSNTINAELTTLFKKEVNINNSSSKFKNDIKSVSDLFFKYSSVMLNSKDIDDINKEAQVLLDLNNYHQILLYYLDDSNVHNDTLLSFMKKDLIIKTATDFALENYSISKRVTIKVRVMNKEQTAELPGYNVFISPYASLDPSLKIQLNPTNNAVFDIRPGDKKVSIFLDGQLIEEREVPVYYKLNAEIKTITFIVK